MINDKLNEIQQKLKAPKGQYNKFGGFYFRSCEDILESVKPLLGTATLKISDEMVMLGDRFYVKATVELVDGEESISVSAYARESLTKKGMDESQITGATSSYARKYALNGLFLIDDTKDADSKDNRIPDEPKEVKKINLEEEADLDSLIKEVGADKSKFLKYYKISKLEDLPLSRYKSAVKALEAKRS